MIVVDFCRWKQIPSMVVPEVPEDVFEARNVEAAGMWFQEQSAVFFLCFFVLPKSDVTSLGQGLL